MASLMESGPIEPPSSLVSTIPVIPFNPSPPEFFATTPLAVTFLSQGAEARVWIGTFLGRPCVVKSRVAKAYRHPDLDAALTHERFVGEARALARARRAGVDAPVLLFCEPRSSSLVLERVMGCTLKAWLQVCARGQEGLNVAAHVGASLARLHAAGLVHGDLTTSNIMLRGLPENGGDKPMGQMSMEGRGESVDPGDEKEEKNASGETVDPGDEKEEKNGSGGADDDDDDDEDDVEFSTASAKAAGGGGASGTRNAATVVPNGSLSIAPILPLLPHGATSLVFIDFGLASMNASVEECGVDLYVLERAFVSAHAKEAVSLFAAVLKTYGEQLAALVPAGTAKDAKNILGKFSAVRMRGRKRLAFG